VSENKLLRIMFGPKTNKWPETGKDCIMGSISCLLHHILLGCGTQENELGVASSTRGKDKVYNDLVGKSEGKSDSEDIGVDGNIMLEWILRK
jgi:hypothetical protein